MELPAQTLGQRLVARVVIVEQGLDGQAVVANLVGGGQRRPCRRFPVPAPCDLAAVALHLPSNIAALELGFERQRGRIASFARKQIAQRARQTALSNRVGTADDVDARIRRLEDEAGLDSGQGSNVEPAKMHQPASCRPAA